MNPFAANCAPNAFNRGKGEWHSAHVTLYLRAKAGMASASRGMAGRRSNAARGARTAPRQRFGIEASRD
jgi:hypothetical protein